MAAFDSVTARPSERRLIIVGTLVLLAGALATVLLGRLGYITPRRFGLMTLVLVAGAAAIVVWYTDPAYSLSAALFLTVFSGHWDLLGFPSSVAPDRFLVLLVFLAVLLRAPGARDRPPIVLGWVHAVLALATLFVVASAAISGTLIDQLGTFRLLDRFGLIPFAIFLIAPVVFYTPRRRAVLIGTFVALGAYLSLTALFMTLGLNQLVFPRYILDPSLGTHLGRARGPFINAAVNGIALYACGFACIMAALWSPRAWMRRIAAPIAVLCAIGLLFTLTRSVWIGATLSATVTVIAVRPLRPFIPLMLVAGLILVGGSLALVPGLAAKATARKNTTETVTGRETLNSAAWNMLKERPLLGFGWATYEKNRDNHLVISPNRQMRILGNPPVHNLLLSNLSELGLVGTSLWLLALALAVIGAMRGPPTPEARPWRIMLMSVLCLWAFVAMASPLDGSFQHTLVWLLAGIASSMAVPAGRAAAAPGLSARRPASAGARDASGRDG